MKHKIRLDPCITPALLQRVMQHKPLPELLQKLGLMAHAKDGVPTVEALEVERWLSHTSPDAARYILANDPQRQGTIHDLINLEFAWHIIAMLLNTSKYPKETT